MANIEELKEQINKINMEYEEKEAAIEKDLSIEFDSTINQIKEKYEKDYRDMGSVKKIKRNLKARISELKYILKLFNKEIKILTKNKKKALKDKLQELDKQKDERVNKIQEEIKALEQQ